MKFQVIVQVKVEVFFNLLRLFVGIKFESHFPFICPKIYFAWIATQISCWQIYIIDCRKSETSSAKSLAFVGRPSERSFVLIKNNNGSRLDPCGTCTSILDHENSWNWPTSWSSSIIDRGCLAQESHGLKPDWFCNVKLFFVKNRNTLPHYNLLSILPELSRKEMGQ